VPVARGGWRSGERLAALVAAVIAGATVAGVVVSLLVWIAKGMADMPVSFGRTPVGVLGLVLSPIFYAAVGGILAARLPRNPIGWLFLLMGAALGMMLPVNLVVATAHESLHSAAPSVVWVAWVRTAFGTPVVLGAAVVAVQLFPHGAPLPGRWKLGPWLGGSASALLLLATAFDPMGLITYPSIPNPMALPYGLRDVVGLIRAVAVAMILASAGVAVASLWLRYRQGAAILRAQLRWIVLAVALTVAAAVPFVIARYVLRVTDSTGEILAAIAQLGSCAFPLAAAFAISKYRLFDVDVVIGRTLVYLPLMAVLGGMYTSGIALFQRVFVAVTGSESDAAIVLTILVVGSVFTPLRRSLESVVDRRFSGGASGRRRRAGEGDEAEGLAALAAPGASLTSGEGAHSIGRVHLARVAADDTVRCPLRPAARIRDCLACPYLRAVADDPQLTIVCSPPA
jgi:hypothetical protein